MLRNRPFSPFFLLFCILFLAALLRFWQFGEIPQGFQVDEAAFGYNAYSLMKTGRDEFGHVLPLVLRSFDDYKGAIYAYVTIPFIAVFGLTEAAVRLPSAIAGLGIVLLSYLITKKLTKNQPLALLTALVAAVSPSAIFLSRVQSDPLLSLLFVLLGLYTLLLWVDTRGTVYLLASGIFWGISLYTNSLPRVIFLFLLPLLLVFLHPQLPRRMLLSFLGLCAGIFLLNGLLFVGNANARFTQISVFHTPTVALPFAERLREDGVMQVPLLITRLLHNKPTEYGFYLLTNYFAYLDFRFLFLNAEKPIREHVEHTGYAYLAALPFFLLGIYFLIHRKLHWGYFVLLWFFLSPLVLIFSTDDTPNLHRFIAASLPFDILVAFGVLNAYNVAREYGYHRVFVGGLAAVTIVSILLFFHELFVHQPMHKPWVRDYAYKSLVAALTTYEPSYKAISATKDGSNTYIFLLFYKKIDPATYLASGSQGNKDRGRFGKYTFLATDCPLMDTPVGKDSTQGKPDVLYVNRAHCPLPTKNTRLLKTIYWRDNTPAFYLLEYTGNAL